MNPRCWSSEPHWVWSATVNPEERLMRQARGKQAPESPLRPNAPLISPHSFLQFRGGGGAITAVAHGAPGHTAGHAAEYTRAAQLLAGREDF